MYSMRMQKMLASTTHFVLPPLGLIQVLPVDGDDLEGWSNINKKINSFGPWWNSTRLHQTISALYFIIVEWQEDPRTAWGCKKEQSTPFAIPHLSTFLHDSDLFLEEFACETQWVKNIPAKLLQPTLQRIQQYARSCGSCCRSPGNSSTEELNVVSHFSISGYRWILLSQCYWYWSTTCNIYYIRDTSKAFPW